MKKRSEGLAAFLCAGLALGACGDPREGSGASGGFVGRLAAGGSRTYATASHTCYVATGGLECWGAAERGQTGDGSLARRLSRPTRVEGLPPPRAVAAGGRHTCVSSGDAVYCFGDNGNAQGGVARPFLLLEPVRVPGLPSPVIAVAAGQDHSCAIAAGSVWCWGRNEAGESGREAPERCREPFRVRRCSIESTRVEGIEGATALALGDRHSCAIAEGTVWCFGANADGQLGDGTRISRGRPAPVQGLPVPATAIAAGSHHSCALVGGQAFCWGRGRTEPRVWSGSPSSLRSLAAGGDHTCAATSERVWCAVGDEPPQVVANVGPDVRALAVSLDHACADVGGSVHCWGENDFGQLGTGDPAGARQAPAWDGGRLRDANGDGLLTVVCLGDSNTESLPGAWPSWCDRLADLLPAGFRVVNRGLGGATATGEASLLAAAAPVSHALENDAPEVAVLAYGTNDVLAKVPAARIAQALAREAGRLGGAGVLSLVALVPPVRSDDAAANEAVRALNDTLRDTFPAERLVDFASDFGDAQLFDRVHLDDGGQAQRAALAARAIVAFLPEAAR